ncbi:MAG: hypothetical protein HYY30_02085 [Chloroflexi bacterium]|nr:hypothetical protein [Chloroflexota bacterium]
MEKIFWVKCPKCSDRFYCDYGLKSKQVKLICPFCQHEFGAAESPEIDDRQ